jgi:AraC-like DNA-binding protein
MIRARFDSRSSPRHMHDELEIGIIETGRRLVQWREQEFIVDAGSILVFAPGQVHAGIPIGPGPSLYRSVLLPASLIASFDLGSRAQRMLQCGDPVSRDAAAFDRMREVLTSLEIGRTDGASEQQFMSAVRDVLTQLADRPPTWPATDHPAVEVARTYIREHYHEPIRLATLASLSGVSALYLIRLFRRFTGLTPTAYLVQVRVLEALRQIREHVGLSEVACSTGFADQSHLTRFFKRLVGVPPGAYRAHLGIRSSSPTRSMMRARPHRSVPAMAHRTASNRLKRAHGASLTGQT